MSENLFRQSLAPGSLIFTEGEAGTVAYVIEEGCVEITSLRNGSRAVLARLGPGELFGEMALIDGQVRSATAHAIEPTILVAVHREQVLTRMASADPLVALLLRVVLERLRRSNSLVAAHSQDSSASPAPPQPSDESLDSMRSRAFGLLTLEQELREGMRHEQFEVFYQPILSTENLRLAGWEALIRWRHPVRGIISPTAFVDVAERCGLIIPIGLSTLRAACHALTPIGAGATLPFMSVNLSPRQVAHPDLVAQVAQAIETSGIAPERLKLEVTESVLLENPETAISVLLELRSLGLAIAVDDFGTGYSSLSYLHRFPIDVLKIDRSFVSNMLNDPQSLKIVRTIARLAKELGLKVVAEGVERREELVLLTDFGCELVQGYLFSPPRPADELVAVLSSLEAWAPARG